ncbi:MAG: hypothetical protein ACRCY9_05645 [Phycicoccus sp.]
MLDQADLIAAAWVQANEESGGSPAAEGWESDDDARRALSHDAVDVLRELVAHVEKGEDLDLTPAPPEVVFLVWDGGADEEPFEDADLVLDHSETYSMCPHCSALNCIIEVDRCERWNEAEIRVQEDVVSRYGVREANGWGLIGHDPNPLAGLPVLSIHQDRDSDFHTNRYACGSCQKEIALPEWVECEWS